MALPKPRYDGLPRPSKRVRASKLDGLGRPSYRPRRAFTLVELLVVVAMLIILVSVLTAAMQPVLAGKEIREAARQVNAFIAGSVARAAQTGRPAGIWIQREPGNTNAAFTLFPAAIPPLYAGDAINSTATFTSATTVDLTNATQATAVAGFVAPGDRIRFFYAGPWYEITAVSGATITYAIGAKPAPPYAVNDAVPFQIERGPRPANVQPVQLPGNTVIDLANSGVGSTGVQFNDATNADPVVILFGPDAAIDRVYYHNGTAFGPQVVFGTIHLLIGRPDTLGAGNLGASPNENNWISINHQTGRTITTENLGGTVDNARNYGTRGEAMGGG